MLAERKTKKKPWTLNPTGKFWSEDSSRFGQKMLEKMGWRKGRGLGKNEDGDVDHVHVTYKSDNKGIGFKGSDDKWIGHTIDFNSLLAGLQDSAEGTEKNEQAVIQDLEGRSKMSKGRVHYGRFVRGKNLSKCSEKEMICVFGTQPSQQEDVECSSQEFDQTYSNEEASSEKGPIASVIPTYTSSLSIQEYFSKKSANKTLKKEDDFPIQEDGMDFPKENVASDTIFLNQRAKKAKQCKRKMNIEAENPHETSDLKQVDESESVTNDNTLQQTSQNSEQVQENETNQQEPHGKLSKKMRKRLKRKAVTTIPEFCTDSYSGDKSHENPKKAIHPADPFEQSYLSVSSTSESRESKCKKKRKQKHKTGSEYGLHENSCLNYSEGKESDDFCSKIQAVTQNNENSSSSKQPDDEEIVSLETYNKPVEVKSDNHRHKKRKKFKSNNMNFKEESNCINHGDETLVDGIKHLTYEQEMTAPAEEMDLDNCQENKLCESSQESRAENGVTILKKSFNVESHLVTNLPWAKAILENEILATTNLLSIKGYGQHCQ